MTLGTKTLLFGVHQFVWHPLFVILAWVRLYRSFPSWRELLCIVVHDWGYWGKPSLKCADGDRHPELGARIAGYLLGQEWEEFTIGHSSKYTARNSLKPSKLMAADKYWHCIVPLWLYKCISIPTKELNHYMETWEQHYLSGQTLTVEQWWEQLQARALKKVREGYQIDRSKLD